jgi:hypothetical protein
MYSNRIPNFLIKKKLSDIVVHMVNFDPIPYTNRIFVGMTLNNQALDQ